MNEGKMAQEKPEYQDKYPRMASPSRNHLEILSDSIAGKHVRWMRVDVMRTLLHEFSGEGVTGWWTLDYLGRGLPVGVAKNRGFLRKYSFPHTKFDAGLRFRVFSRDERDRPMSPKLSHDFGRIELKMWRPTLQQKRGEQRIGPPQLTDSRWGKVHFPTQLAGQPNPANKSLDGWIMWSQWTWSLPDAKNVSSSVIRLSASWSVWKTKVWPVVWSDLLWSVDFYGPAGQ
jgi:hypothetical protein